MVQSKWQSDRVGQIEDSITLAISALAKKMKSEGLDVIGFGAGEPDFDTPEFIKAAAINAIQSGKNKYTDSPGILELREAICATLKKDHGLTYSPKQIVTCVGAKHAIYNAMMAILNPGDEVIIPAPYWVSYPAQVILAAGKPVIVQTDESTEFKISPQQLEAAITPRTKCVIINSPSNPTGMMYTKGELAALAEVIVRKDILVLSDEIYEKLVYTDVAHVSIASISEEAKKRTILVNGVSKAYAMTGWRMGFVAAEPDIIEGINRIQSHSTSNVTTAAQYAALAAYTGPQDAVETMRLAFDRRRKLMVKLLNEIPGVSCLEPQGAFYAFPNISSFFGKKSKTGTITDTASFCDLLLKEALVALVPGIGFESDTCVRLSYATSDAQIEAGIKRIQDWLAALS